MMYDNTKLREYILLLTKVAKNNPNMPTNMQNNDHLINMYFTHILTYDLGPLLPTVMPNISDAQKAFVNVEQGLLQSILLMDFYIEVRKKLELDEASDFEENLFNQIVKKSFKHDFKLIFSNAKYIDAFLKALNNAYQQSGYDKVLAYSILDEEDIEVLESINPFFMNDYKKYAIKIDRSFLLREIGKWINGKNDMAIAIEETAKFLINAFKANLEIEELVIDIINTNQSEEFMQALVDEDINQAAVHLANYYTVYNIEGPKLK